MTTSIGPEYYLANTLMLAASDLRMAKYFLQHGQLRMALGCAECAEVLLLNRNDNNYCS